MGTVRDFECPSRWAAQTLLKGKRFRRVTLNTDLEQVGDFETGYVTSLLLHNHEIVRWSRCGTLVTLYDRGWQTPTTKDRINKCLPPGWRLFSRRRQWFLSDTWDREIKFREGISIQAYTVLGESGPFGARTSIVGDPLQR